MGNQCVFCSTTTDLTTTMQVTTSKGNQTVHICKDHEDDASPKKVRELAEKRNTMLDEFERQAKELGFKLTPIGGGGIVEAISPQGSGSVTGTDPIAQNAPVAPAVARPLTAPIAPKKARPIVAPSVAGSTDLGKHDSYDTTKTMTKKDGTEINAPGIIETAEQTVEGRAGMPVTIPRKIVSEAGTTEFMIVKGGEKKIQDRMKAMTRAHTQEDMNRAINSGYATHDCTLCKGTGITKINNQTCVKCGGAGTL